MTTATSTYPVSALTTASWQTQIDAIHAALVASGWVQTADTGQLVTSAVTYSGAALNLGYRIYKWSDSLSTTLGSLYAKITFLTHISNVEQSGWKPRPKVEVAMGTDGAGNLVAPSALISDVDQVNSAGAQSVGRKASYSSFSVANNYSITVISGAHASWAPSFTNRLNPTSFPTMFSAILLLAVRRLTDKNGANVAGFSVLSSGNQVRGTNGVYSHKLTSSRVTLTTADVWGLEMFNSFAAWKQLAPLSLTPAVQMTNATYVSSDGVLMPFPELAWYIGSSSFTLDASFTNNLAGADRTFRACGEVGMYLLLPDCGSSQNLSQYDYMQLDNRACLSMIWE